jgi:hypothetical protein
MSIDSIQQLRELITTHFEDLNSIKKKIHVDMTAGNIPSDIFWSNAEENTLQYINHGFFNAAYYDTNLDGVVKFRKNVNDEKPILNLTTQSKEEVIKDEKFMKYINNQVSILTQYSRILNTLPTFCHIKGYVVYNNIIHTHHTTQSVAYSPLIEYLKDFKDIDTYSDNVDWSKALPAFLEVVKDFKKFNTTFMYNHKDLQHNCRNIMYNKETNAFKVIDIEEPYPMVEEKPRHLRNLYTLCNVALKDVTGLAKCYINRWNLMDLTLLSDNKEDKLFAVLRAMEDYLWCQDIIDDYPWFEHKPFKENPCDENEIYIDMSNQEVQAKLKEVIDEQYDKLIYIIEQHIKNLYNAKFNFK